MIHLDTNLLVRLTQADARAITAAEDWLASGEALAASAVAWFEFCCGPLPESGIALVERVLAGGIVGFGAAQAERAAALFNLGGRKRADRWDCMIAAAAIESGARLATLNGGDFERFVAAGLKLAAL